MAVRVDINVRNLELSERLRNKVMHKVGKLDRYLDILEEAKVDLTYIETARNANDRYVAQLTVLGKGALLRAEERSDDIYASIDAVLEKINSQIRRYKGRRWRKRGDRKAAEDEMFMEAEEGLAQEPEEAVVRTKRMELSPMFPQEAIEQMQLIGHKQFFLFQDAESGQVNLLYRRRDGSLGLIETETR